MSRSGESRRSTADLSAAAAVPPPLYIERTSRSVNYFLNWTPIRSLLVRASARVKRVRCLGCRVLVHFRYFMLSFHMHDAKSHDFSLGLVLTCSRRASDSPICHDDGLRTDHCRESPVRDCVLCSGRAAWRHQCGANGYDSRALLSCSVLIRPHLPRCLPPRAALSETIPRVLTSTTGCMRPEMVRRYHRAAQVALRCHKRRA